MPSKLTLFFGFACGYVLGSRAGRQRYEEIKRTARRVKDSPSVQGAAGMLQAQADSTVASLRSRLRSDDAQPAAVGLNGHRR